MGKIFIGIHDFLYSITPVYKQLHINIKNIVDKYGNGLQILDVPTTTGNLASILQQNHNVITIDISEEALKTALKKNNSIKTSIFNAYSKIPFSDNTFDGITSTHLLYFLKDKTNIISEYFRVLKPDGFLILTEFDGYKNLINTLKISNNVKGICIWKISDIIFNFINNISLKQYLTLYGLKELLVKHNFNFINCYKNFGNLSNTVLATKNKDVLLNN